jgi:hypothetical protein
MEPREDHEESSPAKEEDVMKKIGSYTSRGSLYNAGADLADGEEVKIQLFDGRFDTGYRVTGFSIWAGDVDDPDVAGRLCTEPGLGFTLNEFWNAGDTRQIAWAMGQGGTDQPIVDLNAIIDPENMIVEDLYVTFRFTATDTKRVNYMITMDKYEFKDWNGALAMVRNRGQGSP